MAFSTTDISKAALLALISTFTIVGNLTVSIVLMKYRRLLLKNRPTYQYILNLVFSDLVVGLLALPFEFVSVLHNEWIFGRTVCKMIEFIQIAASGTTVFSQALIAFDRYRSLARPYLPKTETRFVRKMILLSWIIPAFVSSPYLYMFEILHVDSKILCSPNAIPIKWLDTIYEALEFVIGMLLPFLAFCWCYFRVARMFRGSPLVSPDSVFTHQLSVTFKKKKRVTRTAGLVAVTFTVCWLPTSIINFVRVVSGTDRVHSGHLLHQIAMFCAFFNGAINPIVYCAFDRNIKETLSQHLRQLAICKFDEDIRNSRKVSGRKRTSSPSYHD